jgi:hypothetical protein
VARSPTRAWGAAVSEPARPAWRAAAIRRFAVAGAIFVAGCVLVAIGGLWPTLIGWMVVGLALIVAICLVFLEIGYSEERERRGGR